ncbi:TMEM165/GDT1 family protein [Aquisediminimonas sediminicola]|uniref:TMEM165/GDT1 family protein n=1 Tax=Alteraquisediminimonas sediminicola TaxID=2676787 RepID=UPI0031B863D3
MMMADMLDIRSANLLTGLAIIFAGGSGLFTRKQPAPHTTRHQPLGFINITSQFFMLGFGDKIAFLTFALTARMEQPLLAGIGATIGIVAAHIWPILLGPEWPTIMPLRMASRVIGFVSLLLGLMIAIFALFF